jgi:glucan phosphoethanolaminetransferase (alkaline phosphatase superfamily)
MWNHLIVCVILAVGLVIWWRSSRHPEVRALLALAALVLAIATGYSMGAAYQQVRYVELYDSVLTSYSRLLHRLADRKQLSALTNAVVQFDVKLQADRDPLELLKVVKQLRRLEGSAKSNGGPANIRPQ